MCYSVYFYLQPKNMNAAFVVVVVFGLFGAAGKLYMLYSILLLVSIRYQYCWYIDEDILQLTYYDIICLTFYY